MNSRAVNRIRIMNITVAVGGLMLIKANEAPPMRCGKRRPGVTSAGRQTAKATGWAE